MREYPFPRSRSAWIEKNTEVVRMTEREQNAARPDVDRVDAEVGQLGNDPRAAHEDTETPTDQAIINEERGLESGEENVV
jgi:hypothetical protein